MTKSASGYSRALLDPENVYLEFGPAPKSGASESLVSAARSDKTDGAMIALVPTDADAERLAVPGFEPPDELHLTLWYLGDAVDVSDEQLEELIIGALEVVNDWNPIEGNAFGAALWDPKSDYPAWVLNVGDARTAETEDGDPPYLAVLRDEIGEFIPFDVPKQHTPWQPHICLAYSSGDLASQLISRLGPVTFDRVRIAVGENVIDIPLGDDELVAGAAFHLKGEHDQSTHGHGGGGGGGGGDGKSGGKSLKAGKPLKVTHVLIHKKHEPGTTIAVTKGGQSRLLWTGSQYNIEEKTPNGDWKVQESTKKSKTYQKLQELGVDWYEPEFGDDGDSGDSGDNNVPDDLTSAKPGDAAAVSGKSSSIKLKSLSGLKKTGFTYGGEQYTDAEGNNYALNTNISDKSGDAARNEVVASRLYALAGTKAATVDLVDMNEANPKLAKKGWTLATLAERPKGTPNTAKSFSDPDFRKKMQDDFVVDAWLGNDQIVGVTGGTVTIHDDGSITRLNMGNSLVGLSGSVNEIDEMLNPSLSPYSAEVFSGVTQQQIRDGVKRIAAIKPEQIDALIDDAGYKGDDAANLKRVLKSRRENLIKKFGEDESPVVPAKPTSGTDYTITKDDLRPLEIKTMDGLTKVGPSNNNLPGGVFEDKNGKKWQITPGKTDDHTRNEIVANRLYELVGVRVPKTDAVDLEFTDHFPDSEHGDLATSAEIIDGTKDLASRISTDPEFKSKFFENFAIDAWLGNWDVIGTNGNNVVIDENGEAVRTSAHGSLLFRAMGQPKGNAFGDTVTEIDTLRNPNVNPDAASIYGDITEEDIRKGVAKLEAMDPDAIDELLKETGFTTVSPAGEGLRKKLKARREDLIARFGSKAPKGALNPDPGKTQPPPPPPTPPTPTSPVSTPTPPGPATPGAPSAPKTYSAAQKKQVQDVFAKNDVKWHNDTKKIYDSALEVSKTYPGLTMGDALDIMDQSLKKKTGNPFRTKVEKFLKTNAGKQHALSQGGPGGIGTTSSTNVNSSSVSPAVGVPTDSSAYTPLSAQQANAMQKEMDAQSPPPWTGPQRHALRYYTGSSYTPINKCLRGTGPCTPDLNKIINGIRGGMKPSTRDIVVYRKTNAATFGLASAKQLDDMVGKVIKDDGVVSTSIFKGTWSGQIQMIIEAPKGSNMAWVAPISMHPSENEIIVAPGSHFEIIEVTAGSGGTERTIRLRIIPGSDSA